MCFSDSYPCVKSIRCLFSLCFGDLSFVPFIGQNMDILEQDLLSILYLA